jgi:hypothetical protein
MAINWNQFAQTNNLSAEEFTNEILACATAVCAVILDANGSKKMTRKTHDGVSPMLLTVERLKEPGM